MSINPNHNNIITNNGTQTWPYFDLFPIPLNNDYYNLPLELELDEEELLTPTEQIPISSKFSSKNCKICLIQIEWKRRVTTYRGQINDNHICNKCKIIKKKVLKRIAANESILYRVPRELHPLYQSVKNYIEKNKK